LEPNFGRQTSAANFAEQTKFAKLCGWAKFGLANFAIIEDFNLTSISWLLFVTLKLKGFRLSVEVLFGQFVRC
jgi:hypothetical protein